MGWAHRIWDQNVGDSKALVIQNLSFQKDLRVLNLNFTVIRRMRSWAAGLYGGRKITLENIWKTGTRKTERESGHLEREKTSNKWPAITIRVTIRDNPAIGYPPGRRRLLSTLVKRFEAEDKLSTRQIIQVYRILPSTKLTIWKWNLRTALPARVIQINSEIFFNFFKNRLERRFNRKRWPHFEVNFLLKSFH